ncbi:sensor domain-containing diguanylate cyclase [Desulfurispira natronophila]|uniref:GAF domain-containing protein n=1 Tax=Desulfurispira natronophila TaxID=682562 RepID=A0A7W7Y450_9BACT|nr:GAF domain-containing protein [Desulfurispira natronophila]MBB5021477.1 GAF domain-containing protein [Desulfurispira natronophila]
MNINREIDQIIQLVASVTDAFTAAFFILNSSRTSLKMLAHHTLSKNIIPDVQVALDDSVLGVVYKHGKVFDVNRNERTIDHFDYYSTQEDIKSFIGVPVADHGLLVVDTKRQFGFNDRDKKILTMFAAQLESTLITYQQYRYYEEKAGYFDILQGFNRIIQEGYEFNTMMCKVVRLLCARLDVDTGLIAVVDPTRKTYSIRYVTGETFSTSEQPGGDFGTGLIGWICQHKKPLVLGNVRSEGGNSCAYSFDEPYYFQSFLGYPVFGDGKVLAVIALLSAHEEHFNSHDTTVFQLLANYLAITRECIILRHKFSEIDPLTRLYNERFFLQTYETIIQKAGEAYVVYIELERVDKITNKFGFATVEVLLRKVAANLERIAGPGMIIAAFAPGQFGVLIPTEYSTVEAQHYMEAVQEELLKESVEADGKRFQVFFRMTIVRGSAGADGPSVLAYAQGKLHSGTDTAFRDE